MSDCEVCECRGADVCRGCASEEVDLARLASTRLNRRAQKAERQVRVLTNQLRQARAETRSWQSWGEWGHREWRRVGDELQHTRDALYNHSWVGRVLRFLGVR